MCRALFRAVQSKQQILTPSLEQLQSSELGGTFVNNGLPSVPQDKKDREKREGSVVDASMDAKWVRRGLFATALLRTEEINSVHTRSLSWRETFLCKQHDY
jgi:hypothetical protein